MVLASAQDWLKLGAVGVSWVYWGAGGDCSARGQWDKLSLCWNQG